MPRHWLSLLIIILLTTLFLALWESPPENFLRKSETEAKPNKYPQSYLSGVETTQYGEEGDISYIFKAEKISYFQHKAKRKSKRDYTLIDKPYITFYDGDKPPRYVRANNGRSTNTGKTITLWGNVKIWHIDEQGNKTELSSSRLVVKPEQQYAETNKAVTITDASGRTQAVGMKAFLKQDRIQLLSKVKSIHESI